MKNIFAKTGFATLSMLFVFFFSLPQVEGKTRRVNCDNGESIQAKLNSTKPGDVIEVKGTCNERVIRL